MHAAASRWIAYIILLIVESRGEKKSRFTSPLLCDWAERVYSLVTQDWALFWQYHTSGDTRGYARVMCIIDTPHPPPAVS